MNYHFNQGNHDIEYFNCANNNKARKTCSSTHYIRADFLEQIVIQEIQRLTAFAASHENEFVNMVIGFSQQAEMTELKRNEKELNKLLSRNKEIDKLFERLYEDNVSGKINDERFSKMSANYDTEQADNNKRIKVLRDELQQQTGKQYAADSFVNVVKKYINPKEITQIMLSELIKKIKVYHAEKIDGQTVQRLNIHYNFVGEIELPESAQAETETKIHTRKGVDVIYSPNSKAV